MEEIPEIEETTIDEKKQRLLEMRREQCKKMQEIWKNKRNERLAIKDDLNENERDKEAKEIEKAKILRLYNNDTDNTDNPKKHYKTLLKEKRAE